MRRFMTLLAVALIAIVATLHAAEKPKVAVVVKTLTGDIFQLKLAEAARDHAISLGAEAEIYQAGGHTAVQKMVQIIEDVIVKGVDIIVISPLDAKSVVPAFQLAKEEGVLVVCMDQSADGDDFLTYVATDNYAAATLAADYAKEILGGKGKVMIIEGAPGSSTAIARRDGFGHNVVKDSSIVIAASQSGYWQNDKAMEATQNVLQANPDVDLIFCSSDVMVGGVVEAVKLAGKEGQMKIISFDGSGFGMNLVKDGRITADIGQFPIKIGQIAVETALDVLSGKVKAEDVPRFIDSGNKLITKDNVEESLPDAF
ncbi:MAG: sugar ABC transporter substrate-binding protein [Planctomycetaceae bacterium]|nr:sugar ABC transporter substrate-binding protein [Planctomycetaceae bacterium]